MSGTCDVDHALLKLVRCLFATSLYGVIAAIALKITLDKHKVDFFLNGDFYRQVRASFLQL